MKEHYRLLAEQVSTVEETALYGLVSGVFKFVLGEMDLSEFEKMIGR